MIYSQSQIIIIISATSAKAILSETNQGSMALEYPLWLCTILQCLNLSFVTAAATHDQLGKADLSYKSFPIF